MLMLMLILMLMLTVTGYLMAGPHDIILKPSLLSISPNIPNFLGRPNFLRNIPNFRRFRIFYGVFTTPRNAILGSAVCRFSVDDMESSFEGNFKNQESLTSNWLPMSSSQVSTDPILLRFPFFS